MNMPLAFQKLVSPASTPSHPREGGDPEGRVSTRHKTLKNHPRGQADGLELDSRFRGNDANLKILSSPSTTNRCHISIKNIVALMLCAGLSACALTPRPVATHEVWGDGTPVPRNSAEIVADQDARNNPPPPPEPYRGGGTIYPIGGYNGGWLPGNNVDIFYQDHNRFNMHFGL